MKNFNVGTLKTHFSEILEQVKNGEEVAISYGKSREKIAVIIPFRKYRRGQRRLGLLAKKGKIRITKDFKMTEEEFLLL